jgi:hypothetical protein
MRATIARAPLPWVILGATIFSGCAGAHSERTREARQVELLESALAYERSERARVEADYADVVERLEARQSAGVEAARAREQASVTALCAASAERARALDARVTALRAALDARGASGLALVQRGGDFGVALPREVFFAETTPSVGDAGRQLLVDVVEVLLAEPLLAELSLLVVSERHGRSREADAQARAEAEAVFELLWRPLSAGGAGLPDARLGLAVLGSARLTEGAKARAGLWLLVLAPGGLCTPGARAGNGEHEALGSAGEASEPDALPPARLGGSP